MEFTDKSFYIVSHEPDMVVDVEERAGYAGSKVILYNQKHSSDNLNQLFYRDPINKTIRSVQTHYTLDIQRAKNPLWQLDQVVMNPLQWGATTQKWVIEREQIIKNVGTGLFLRCPGIFDIKPKPTASIELINDQSDSNVSWKLQYASPRYFYLKNRRTKKVMDVAKKQTYPGASVITYAKDKMLFAVRHKDNQLWMEDTSYHIRTKLNHFALDAMHGKRLAINYAKPKSEWQKWTVVDGFITNVTKPDKVISLAEDLENLCVAEKDMGSYRQQWIIEYV